MEKDQSKRVAIYIDGSNFYHKMKDLEFLNLTKFNYRGLADWLALGREVVSYRYYVGVVRTGVDSIKGQELRKEQQRLFAHLSSAHQGFAIKRGYLMENNGKYHEKGVDVKIAVDLLVGAYDNLYDAAIVLSSDTDLIPAIKKIKHLGKEVEYIGFAHNPSLALQKHATLSRLLIKEEIEPFSCKTLL
jgi:uncharacterized LabA/DUF88 family protein